MKALFKPSGKSKKIPPNQLVGKLTKSLAALEELKLWVFVNLESLIINQ